MGRQQVYGQEIVFYSAKAADFGNAAQKAATTLAGIIEIGFAIESEKPLGLGHEKPSGLKPRFAAILNQNPFFELALRTSYGTG
jgi:hypothetical protein